MNANPPANLQNTNQPLKAEVKQFSPRRKAVITLLALLMLGGVISITALHLLAPAVPGRAESFPARAGWYLTHDQWRADTRTFAAAWTFWMQRQDELPTANDVTNQPIAVTPTDSLPKS